MTECETTEKPVSYKTLHDIPSFMSVLAAVSAYGATHVVFGRKDEVLPDGRHYILGVEAFLVRDGTIIVNEVETLSAGKGLGDPIYSRSSRVLSVEEFENYVDGIGINFI